MSDLTDTLKKFDDEAQALKQREVELQADLQLFNEKLGGFLKSTLGLQDNFTIPAFGVAVAEKARG